MRDYLGRELKVAHKLVYNGDVVGFRLNIGGKGYDVDYDNFMLFLNSHNDSVFGDFPRAHIGIESDDIDFILKRTPALELVNMGDRLAPLNDKVNYAELTYNDLCILTGTFFTPTVIDLKMLYDDINKKVFNGMLPNRVAFNWNYAQKSAGYIITDRKVALKDGNLGADNFLTNVEIPYAHVKMNLDIFNQPKREFFCKLLFVILVEIKNANYANCSTLSPSASSQIGFNNAFNRYLRETLPNRTNSIADISLVKEKPVKSLFPTIPCKVLAENKYKLKTEF